MNSTRTAPSTEKTLRRLFLALFLRGRSSRGIQKGSTPSSIGRKLFFTLALYAAVGLMALLFLRQPVFPLAIYMHAMTFVFTGMFVASSSGEMLFNKEEADILLHRPVTPRQLLWAKVGVLVRISLWLAFAFNAVGLVVGIYAPGGTVWYPVVHAVSLSCEAIFCTALVIVVYQLCLRWFGREWLDQMMTTAQVVVAIGAVVAGQVVPRMIRFVGRDALFQVDAWWISLIPPAWFAGFDDALAGSHAVRSWWLAGGALAATGFVVWLSFGVLARDFGAGLQKLGESRSIQPRSAGQGRLLRTMVGVPPLKWWLREPVSRASFLLAAAYLVRDRDVKLRVYPSLAPILIMPFAMMLSGSRRQWDADDHVIGLGLAGAFLAIMPAMGLNLLRFSQQWQAADVFRVAPMPGPAPLCHGARKAAILFLGLPLFVAIGIIAWLFMHQLAPLALLLPGLIALPLFSLIPCLRGQAVPLSISSEEAKSANRGLSLMGVMLLSMAISGVAAFAQHFGFFWWMILAECVVAAASYVLICAIVAKARWPSLE